MQLTSLFRPTFIDKCNCTPFFNKWAKDNLVAIFFFVLGGSIALIFYQKIGYTFFYQNFVPEAILWACGYDFTFPKKPIDAFIPFLKGQDYSFECGQIGNLETFKTAGLFASAQPYLTWSTAILWRWLGVSYQAISPLIFILWGAYASGLYLLFRQFTKKWVSVIGTLFICLSPVMVSMIGSLRDFSKAPFIIWTIVLLIASIRKKNQNASIILASCAGAVAGIGMGFRSDLYIFLPIGIVFLIIGTPTASAKSLLEKILVKAKISFAFTAIFIGTASPILLKNVDLNGVGGYFVMQGMSEPFRLASKLLPAGYTTGWMYSDELTLSSIAADERKLDPKKWDKVETSKVPGLSVSQSFTLATKQMFNWADIFLGDFANQSLKSIMWIIAFPVFISNINTQINLPFEIITPQSIILKIYSVADSLAIVFLAIIGFILFVFKELQRSKNNGLALTFLILFLGAYPAIQFNIRHFFYLEFIWILCFVSLFSMPYYISQHRDKLALYLRKTMLIGTGCFFLYFSIVTYQKWALNYEVDRLLGLPRQKISFGKEVLPSRDSILHIPIPHEFIELTVAQPDSMTPQLEFIGTEWDVRAGAARYLLRISGEDCHPKDIDIGLNYRNVINTWQPLSTSLKQHLNSNPKEFTFLFTGFYRPTQHLENISIPSNLSNCNIVLEKILGESRLPLFFSAYINSNKISGPLIKGIGPFK